MDCRKTPLKPARVLGSLLVFSAVLVSASTRDSVDALVRDAMRRDHVAGVSLAVSRSGNIALAAAYGLAKTSPAIKVTPQTAFSIGSITKQFTAAAIVREIQAGRVRADAPLGTYLPQYAPPAAVTIDMLLHHTSGIVSYEDVLPAAQSADPRALAFAVLRSPLRFAPGAQFAYSNSDSLMLGLLLESLEHRPYADIIASWFTGPLELRATRYASQARLTTQGYDESGSAVAADPPGYLFASAGLIANALDVVHWEDALYGGTVLGGAATNWFFAPAPFGNGNSGYGMGATVAAIDGRTVFYQTGNVSGYSAIVLHQTHAHLTIALLTNRDRLDLVPLAKSVLRLFDPSPERLR